jgi:hypothetical protein
MTLICMSQKGGEEGQERRKAVSELNQARDFQKQVFIMANKMTRCVNGSTVLADRPCAALMVRRSTHGQAYSG